MKSPDESKWKDGDWVEVTGNVTAEKQQCYKGTGPVILADSILATEQAESELVYFN